MALSIPQTSALLAGKYRVERVIGQGAMGVVLEATHLGSSHRVALKLLRQKVTGNPLQFERFRREVQAAVRVKNAHIARLLDVGVLPNGVAYLAMELLQGRDLARLLQEEGPLTEDRAVGLILQACEAMAEAHASGIVHRDLKPANLFVAPQQDGSELLKVLDFGTAKFLHDQGTEEVTLTIDVLGSPMYMAPEQIRSAKYVDERADVWALGLILYELLSGQFPFDTRSLQDLVQAISLSEPRALHQVRPDISTNVQEAIRWCLQKSPPARCPSMEALATKLHPAPNRSPHDPG